MTKVKVLAVQTYYQVKKPASPQGRGQWKLGLLMVQDGVEVKTIKFAGLADNAAVLQACRISTGELNAEGAITFYEKWPEVILTQENGMLATITTAT